MKRLLLLTSIILLCFGLYAEAATVRSGDFLFDKATGSIVDYLGYSHYVTIPTSIDGVKVVRIGYRAFQMSYSTEMILIPEGITNIGSEAFYYCQSLHSINIPSSVTTIGYGAFFHSGVSAITVNPKNSVYSSIDGVLFNKAGTRLIYYPSKGKELYIIPSGVTTIEDGAFFSCSFSSITIPPSVQSIKTRAFSHCDNLINVAIPSSVTSIENKAFHMCANLKNVYVASNNLTYSSENGVLYDKALNKLILYPEGRDDALFDVRPGVKVISSDSFARSRYLTGVSLPDGVTTIETGAFASCVNLLFIDMPSSISDIQDNAFNGNNKLITVNWPSELKRIGSQAFMDCWELDQLTIPLGVVEIQDDAFAGCSSITSVTLPSSIVNLGARAFINCTGLEEITIEPGIKTIANEVFRNCTSLKELIIPNSVTSIGSGSFGGCISLSKVTIPTSVISIELSSFINHNDSLTLFVSQGSYAESYAKKLSILYQTTPIFKISTDQGIILGTQNDTVYCEIPAVINNVKIESIGRGAFEYSANLKEVIIEEGIQAIESEAFFGCGSLEIVKIPSSISFIAPDAFLGCDRVMILCVSGSYAELFAKEHKIKYGYF